MSKSSTIKALSALVEKQAAQITGLLLRIETMEALALKQQQHIEILEQQLAVYKNRKNSGNSHIPPSVDLGKPKRNQSLREKIFAKTCACGHINKGEFPVNVNAKVQYGSHIEALTAYLNVRQYMPYNRIQEFYSRKMA